MIIHPTNPNILFAAGGQIGFVPTADTIKGVYRSTDGGENWEMVKRDLVYTFPANNRAGGMIVFGANTTVYAGSQGTGLWKSTDNGTTWSQFVSPMVGTWIASLTVDPNDRSILYVSSQSNGTIHKVVDTGPSPTITTLHGLPSYANVLVIDKNNSNIMYATLRERGVYKSTNGGGTWAASNSGLELLAGDWTSRKEVTGLAISPVNSNYLYVSRTQSKFYYSHNAGATWHEPASMDELNVDGWVSGSLGGYADVQGCWQSGPTVAHPTNPDIAYAVGEQYHVRKTTNAGLTWTYSNNGYMGGAAGVTATASDSTAISWSSSDPNRFVWTAMDMGAYLTTDGGSTFRFPFNPRHSLVAGLEARSASAGAMNPSDPNTIIITSGQWTAQAVTVTHNANAPTPTWSVKHNTVTATHSFVAFHPQRNNVVYAHRFKSTDNGDTWLDVGKKIVTMYRNNGDIVYGIDPLGADMRIAKSTNSGSTWNYPFPNLVASNHFINSGDIGEFAVDPANDNVLWVAVSKFGVYKITAGGRVELKSNGITPDFHGLRYTKNIAIDPRNHNILYASGIANHIGSAQGVFRSTDGGEHWMNINYNLGSHFTAWALEVNPHNSYVYIGSYEGTWKLPPP